MLKPCRRIFCFDFQVSEVVEVIFEHTKKRIIDKGVRAINEFLRSLFISKNVNSFLITNKRKNSSIFLTWVAITLTLQSF